jgi:prolyl 4-hydroxylase
LVPSGVDYYYDDGADGVYQGRLNLGQESTTNTYEGHVFYFTRVGDKSAVLERAVISKDKVLYLVRDEDEPPPQRLLDSTEEELSFMREYKERTGIHWRHYYGPNGPRGPPELHMWPANEIGHVHRVTTEAGYWQSGDCGEEEEVEGGGGLFGMFSSAPKKGPCKKPGPLNLTLEVISTAPKAFVIENFLSEYEADKIIEMSKNNLGISTVGNDDGGGARTDATRTSMNTWLGRQSSVEMETLFLRAADVLRVDEKLLNREAAAEDLQVVHYENGQKYDSHHDWGVSGYPESRFITLLLYLTDQPDKRAGGETSFPKADSGRGIKVHPGKGSAVLFYNLLEDGNGDDLALHAALPVRSGHEKFLANWWVWCPRRR